MSKSNLQIITLRDPHDHHRYVWRLMYYDCVVASGSEQRYKAARIAATREKVARFDEWKS